MTMHPRPHSLSAALLWAALLAGCTPRTIATSAAPVASEETVTANGVRLAYVSFGPADGEAVLLIAGTGMQLIDWPRALIDELVRRDYRVIVFDNRDVGHSTKFDAAGLPDNAAVTAALTAGKSAPIAYGLRDMARDAVGLLDALGIARAHILGASMGGNIGQYMAIDAPARVRSLVTVGSDDANPALPVIADPAAFAALPPAPAHDDTAAYIEYQMQVRLVLAGTGFPADADSVRAQVRRGVERAYDPAGLQRQQVAALVDRYEPDRYRLEHLAAIRVPTVVLQGADDPLQPLETARDLASRVPGAELRIIPGMGHDIPPQLASAIADAVVAAASRSSTVPH